MITTLMLSKMASIIIALTTFITGSIVPDVAILKSEMSQLQMDNIATNTLVTEGATKFGATRFVAGGRYQLAGSGISSSATSIVLKSLTIPISGTELSMAAFGDIGYATIEPGSTTKKEFISFTGITQSGSNTEATLTTVVRGLSFVSPYTASTTHQLAHSGGSTLIFSNAPAFYNRFAIKDNDESITGTYTFSASAIPIFDSDPTITDDKHFATKKYADDLTNQGAATATDSTAGIVFLATREEIASSTAVSAGEADLVLTAQYASSTAENATSMIAVTHSDGKLDQNFFDLTEAFTWTGKHIFNTLNMTIGSGLLISGNASTTGDLLVSGNSTTTGLSAFVATTTFTDNIIVNNTNGGDSQISTTTFTGMITLPAIDPDADNEAVRKSYVDDQLDNLLTRYNWALTFRSDNTPQGATSTNDFVTTTVPANSLSTENGIRIKAYITFTDEIDCESSNMTIGLQYGSTEMATAVINSTGAADETAIGIIDAVIFGNEATNAQVGTLQVSVADADISFGGFAQGTGTATEDSTGALDAKLTVKWSAKCAGGSPNQFIKREIGSYMEIIK